MDIKEYTLKNDKLEVSFINLGASITKLIDLNTGINIIVGHQDLNSYKNNNGYMNSIIGRHAGRILDFEIDENEFILDKNVNNLYQLHGGLNGFHSKYFKVYQEEDHITFSTTSQDGEGGFPGDINFKITYKLIDNELHLIYEAMSNKKTLMSYTNHSYFNLSGNVNNTILDHELYINADYFLELDDNMIPFRKSKLRDTPLDFSITKIIGEDINKNFSQLKIAGGFDHPYIINKKDYINHVASLYSKLSHMILDIYSDQDAVVFYSGNFIDDSYVLNNGVKGKKHNALCLETQGIPNSYNIKEFKSCNIYKENEVYKQITIWKVN